MRKTTFFKVGLLALIFLQGFISYSQNLKEFTPRFDSDVKGSMIMFGNNILSKDNSPYNEDKGALSFNENIDMKYIDIDGDAATFSSSSADLIMPNPQCFKIVYAGLYWGALLQTGSRSDIDKIKLKVPGGSYQDVTGEVIYDAGLAPIGTNNDKPYACYADITALVQAAVNPIGTYTVANVTSSLGFSGTTGLAAGWNLIVIYEDPTKSAQSITTFDGFSAVRDGINTVFNVTGFRSRPSGLVNLAFGIAGLEGDKNEVGSKLEINGKAITTNERPSNHFFNSTINNLAGDFTARNPNGSNTLGFDSGIISVANPSQTVVANNATSAQISLQMAKGQGGTYFSYFNVFAIDIIAPEIVLTKQVQDAQGNDASTANVVLGQNLFYVIGFENIGNDPATEFTIRDVLPNNIIFNYPADITYLPPGVTATYDAASRSITFSIDKTLVEIGDPRYEIRFKVQVVPTCNQLSSACSNEITNQAFATYRGVENALLITDDPSLPSYTSCNITTAPSATNFLVGVSGCSYGDSQVLCGNNVLLTASNGYASYSWSRDPSGVPVIGTGQTFLATELGKYYVHNTAAPPCFLNIVEEITVVPFGNTVTNPIIPFADNVVTCPNNGKPLPLIYLCGANASKAIETNVSDGSTIVWEKLNESAACPAATSTTLCANESGTCIWSEVGTGPNYTATAAGQYRMTLNYSGGCFNRFYFNVYQNLLSPNVTKKDIVCNTPGRITVGGVPSGYEYSLSPTGPFQSSNVFDIPTQNLYTVYIRQVEVSSNPCLFTVPDIFIRKRNFTVSTIATAPLCNGGKGSLKLAANDVEPQYFYKISQGGAPINSVGPIPNSDYTFANLNPGVYDVEVSTEDGCIQAFQATVPDTPPLTATVTLTKPLTCTDGEITVYPVGGTAPYTYFVNNSTNYETSAVIAVPTAGVYTIDVFDANSCTTRVSIAVAGISPPTFDVVKTDLSCSYVVGDGTISLTSIVPNGNALRYSIDNGVTFLNSPIFTDLTAGNYNVVVEYSVTYATGTSVCTTPPQSITIAVPMAITGSATLTAPYACLQTATIEAQSVSGGTGVYQYSINGTTFQASNVFTGLTDGTYTITIKDANNCTFVTNAVTVAPLTPPTNLDFSATDLTCPSNRSNVTLSATGGFGVKTYQITAPAGSATPYQSSNVFSGLAPGTYTFQVKDEKDCTYQESYSIAPLPTVAVVGQVVSNVQCFGTNTGSVRFTVSGSTGFTYTINGTPQGVGASPIDLINQTAGTYTIVITNTATNCTATTSVAIAQPAEALSVTTTVTPIKCNANGSVVVNATGGWGGNSYTLTQPDTTVAGPQPSNTFANLTQPGTYTVSVTDSNNCTQTNTFILSTPADPTASIDPSSDLCFDGVNAAKIVVSATPGTGTILEYNINGGLFQASNTFGDLSPGSYTVIVRDDYGCSVTLPIVTIAPQLAVSTVLTKDLDCNSPPDAVITGTISGGYPDYSYKVSFNSGDYGASVALGFGVSTIVYNTLIAGTYQFEITDAKGCTTQSAIITVNPIINPSATLTVINPSCNGFSDGSVQIVPSGGVGPYTYSFDGSPFTAVSLYPNLKAGILYAYEVRDSKNCPFTGTVTLTEPTALVATVSATVFKCDATNAKQSATVTIAVPTTGTAPYQYSFDGGANYSATYILTVNDNGTDQDIYYAVKDANGCTDGGMVTITKFNPPTDITFTQVRPITCIDLNSDVSLTMPTANNGVAPFTFENSTTGIQNTTGVFTSLTPGTYVFKVTDANGCFYTESYIVEAVVSITVAGQLIKDVSCNGGSDGTVNFTVSNFTGSYRYSVNGGALVTGQNSATINLTGLPTGNQKIDITDEMTGCVATATIFVPEPAALTLVLVGNINANCNFNTQISVTAGGGTPNYTYAFVQNNIIPNVEDYSNSDSAILDPATNLNWDVWVKDAKGCTEKLDVTIVKDDVPTITAPALQCYIGSPLNITVIGTVDPDFTPAEQALTTYSIGGAYQSSPNFTLNVPGIYTLSIKDKNGCIATTTYEVKLQLLLGANMTQDLTCLVNANVVLTASGGTGAYPTYEVSHNGDGYASITGSPYTTAVAGTYQFRVTDSQGCQSVSNMITVTPKTTPTFATAKTNVSCFGGNNGSIVVTASLVDGIAPFQYSKDGGATFQASNVFAGLFAGTYTIVVKDSKGCDSEPMDVTITQPIILTASSSITTPLTCGAGNAAQPATVTVTGIDGAGGYQYSFDGGVNYSATNTYQSYVGITLDVWVKDVNGCTYKLANGVDIPALNPPTDLTFTLPSDTRCTTVQAAVTNGTGVGPLTYEITFPVAVSNSTGTFSNLAEGTYVFKVTDANGCYYTESYTVTPIAVSGLKIADVKCFGDNDGAIQYTVSGNAIIRNYTYTLASVKGTTILPVQTGNTLDVTGLIADTYTMTVTDKATGCTASSIITIAEPDKGLTITETDATHVHCNNYNSQITVTAVGGTKNHTYAAVIAGADAPTIYGASYVITVDTNSGANLSWDVYVKDIQGCTTMSTVTVILDSMPTVVTTSLATDQCTSDGSSYIFTATGTGVAPLSYSIGGSFQTSSTFTVSSTGLYTITVKDGNGCTDTTEITIYPVLTASAVLTADLDCIDPTDATIRIDASGGLAGYTYEVSFNGGTFEAPTLPATIVGNIFTTDVAGNYQFEVSDANGCKKVSNPITINPKVDPVITSLDQTQDIYCNGEATASITVNIDASKGIGPFTYNINGGTFQASNVFSGLVAGTYDVIVKDSKGCTITNDIIIDEPEPLVFNPSKISKTDIICGGGGVELGTITIVGTAITGHGGSAPYTYILTNNVGAVTQTESLNFGTSDFTFPIGLSFGTYTLSVVDANGCTKTEVITIASPPDEIQIDVAAVATGCTSEVLVTAIGPNLTTGPFHFSIYTDPGLRYPGLSWISEDPVGSKKTTFSGLIQNVTYSFVVFDESTGCYYYQQATTPTITTTNLVMVRVVTDVTCKGADDGNVVVTLDSGTATSIDYQVYNSQTNQPISPPITGVAVASYPFQLPVIGGLIPGSYYVVVTEHGDPTFEGCKIATTPFDIVEATTELKVTALVVKNDNCNSEAGQIVTNAQGGATMSKSDPYVTPPIESVPVPYQYQILLDSETPPTASDGNWDLSNTFMKNNGNYTVYAMDANKCIKSFPITLDLDPSPAITLAVTDKCAVEGTFEIVVNEATAGVAPYSISVNGSAYQNFSFVPGMTGTPGTPDFYTISNLNSGIYDISVRDVNGCISTESVTLYKKVSANAVLTKEFDCTASPNAIITTNIFNGFADFTYRVKIDGVGYGGSNPVAGTSFNIEIIPTTVATTYQFEITDDNGCIVETNVITIQPIENPTATTIVTNATCSGTLNGSVTIIPSLGVGPYTFSFNSSGFTSNVTYGGLAGSVAGTPYNYQVKDSYDCIFDGTATVFEPTPVAGTIDLTQSLTCGVGNASQTATVTVTPTSGSGTAPYYYSFNGGGYSTNNVYTTNIPGNVNALIKDGNGCEIAAALTQNVPALNPPTDLGFTPTAVTCLALTSDVTLTTTNGEVTLSYSILLPASATSNVSGASSGIFIGLLPDTYLFQVTDANGCTYQESYEVKPVIPIAITGLKLTDVNCNGGNTGAIKYTVSGYAGTYTAVLTAGTGTLVQTGNTVDLTGLVADTYTVTVTDNITGCPKSSTITINQPSAGVSIISATATNVHCNNDNSQITVTATGGTPNYTYAVVKNLLPAVTPPPIAGAYSAGNILTVDTNLGADLVWDVYVKDLNGCTVMTTVIVVLDPMPTVITPALASNQCSVSSGFTFTATGTGIAPLSYSINAGLSYQNSPDFTVNTPGSYTVTIKDGNGCIATSPTPTNVYSQLTVLPTVTKELDCSVSPNAEITVIANGGSTPFTYRLQIGAGAYSPSAPFVSPFIYSAATADTYTFEITDANGCIVTNATSVTPITNPTATETHVDISCNGGSDGSVQIIPAGGSGGYQYSFDGSPFSAKSLYTGLSAGIAYPYQVKDSKGCISIAYTVTLIEPTALVANATLTTSFSCGIANASQPARITIDVPSTGTAPYQYSFNGSAYTNVRILDVNDNGTDQTISYSVRDAHGCTTTAKIVTLLKLNPPTDLTFIGTPVWCAPLANQTSTVTLSPTNGVGALTYTILPSLPEGVTQPMANQFEGLLPGTYLFQVIDTNGCFYQESYTVDPVKRITVAGQLVSDVSCFGTSTGKLKFTVGNLAGAYTYLMTSGTGLGTITQTANVIDIEGLPIGTYTIRITDSITGCFADATVVVNQPPVLLLTLNPMINANCNFNAQVSVTAAGGTPGYKYSFVADGLPAEIYTTSNSAVLDPGVKLNWDVWVMDAKGCTAKLDVTIVKDPLPTVTVPALASNQCNTTGALYTFTAAGASGIPPYEYSIGNGYQVSPMFAVAVPVVPTLYTVTIKDANGCTAVSPTSVMIYAPLGLSANFTASPICNNADGVITATATGGSTNYNYTLLDSASVPLTPPQSTGVFSTLAAGSYQVKVTDLTTACEKTVAVILSAPTPVTFTTSVTYVSCKGGNNGVIAVNLGPGINDNPVYTYEITAGPTLVSPQTSSIFTGLTAGTYTVRVNSGRGCFFADNVVVNEPLLALSVSGTATPFACAPDNIKTVSTVTVTELAGSGTSPYLYSIDGISYIPTNTFSVIDKGFNYDLNVFVKDAKGCIANGQVSITTLIPLTGTVSLNAPIDCNGTGSIAISANGGSGNYSYQLLPSGVAQPSNIFNITTPGTYYFQVNDTVTGCFITTAAYTVVPFNTIDVVAMATTSVTCFGDANGAISINVTGYTGAFDYEVFDNLGSSVANGSGIAPTTQLISGLSAGNFTVKVTEKMTPFCVKTSNVVTVASPVVALAVVANETASVTCANNQGTIIATGTGGWGSLQYELVGPINVAYSTSSTFNNLVAGNYTVNVKDAKGCIGSSNLVQLSVPTPITVTASPNVAAVSCKGHKNATITAGLPTGGQGSNYLYTLNTTSFTPPTASGPQASPVFDGLGAGTYTITVTDGYSCSATSAAIVITEPTEVKSNLVVATTQTCLDQTTLTLSATGGTPPYMYSTDPNFGTSMSISGSSVTFPVTVGTYHYYVKDANGCDSYVSNDIQIDPLPTLIINLDKTNAVINCAGDNTGVIVSTAQGGLGNYIYTLQDTSGNDLTTVQASPGVFTQLFAGTYQVKVESGDCSTTSSIITITQPLAPLEAPYTFKDVTCNGANNGSIEINASGGTGIIKYAISPNLNQFFDSNIFDKLAPGNYDVIAQDVLGCYVKINFDITEPAPIVASTIAGTILPEICAGDKDGAFSIAIAGGTLPYSVSLDDPNGTYTTGTATQTEFDFTDLSGGNHFVFIRDANGCTTDWLVALPESINMNPIAVVQYDCVNNAAVNTVTISIDDSITDPADVDYALDGSADFGPSSVFTDLAPGPHFVTARHSNGCEQQTMIFDIVQVDPLTLVLNDGGLNEIVAVAAGGGGGYTYTLNGESYGTSNSFIISESGEYTVTVTDANGCVATATGNFKFIDVCIPNYFTPNGDGVNDGWAPGCTINYKDLTFDIFDRYGRKVGNYRTGQYWDGKYKGAELPSGDYWYVLRLNDMKDAREFVGHFTLYR